MQKKHNITALAAEFRIVIKMIYTIFNNTET